MTLVDVTFTAPLTAELAAGDDPEPRTISGLAVPFGVPSAFPDSLSRAHYRFDGPPANLEDLVDVVRGHDPDAVIGRLAAAWEPDETGMPGRARIFSTTAGNDALVEAREGVLTGFSLGAEIARFTEDADGVRGVGAGDYTVKHLGIVRGPAFTQSAGLTVAASREETPAMTATATEPAVVELTTIAEIATEVRAMMAADAPARHPLAEFASERAYLTAFFAAVRDDDQERVKSLQAAFAVPDQITTDNPGVIPPGWRTDVKMNLDDRRPAIQGTGGAIGLPPAGMDSNWPYFAGDLDAIITAQAAEKTDLAGVKISILKGTAPIKTAGTVSDISYQLLLRSSPEYLSAYLAICRAAWARYTEAKYEAALFAGGTASGAAVPTNAASFSAALFTMSSEVEDATGTPATVVGVAKDLWNALGGLPELFNPSYGTNNASGTSSAATLQINVNGLQVTRWPFLANGSIVATNGAAAKFAETGAMVASAEDVRKLGRDVAVWGMYEDAEIYFPAGVRKLTGVAPPLPLATSTSKK